MDWRTTINSHWGRMSKLKAWAGTIGLQALEDHHSEQMKNIQAENQQNRAMLSGKQSSQADEDMRQTVLGDYVTNVTHQVPPASQIGKILLGVGLAAAGAGMPVAGWFIANAIANRPVPEASTSTTTNTTTGLDEDTTIQLNLPDWEE